MGKVKLAIGLLVIVAACYVGAALIPVYYANYEFQDVIKTEATLQTYTNKPEADIQQYILKRAQDLDIPVERDHIKVRRRGSMGVGSLTIEAPYTVHVALPGYPMDLYFDPSTENKSPF